MIKKYPPKERAIIKPIFNSEIRFFTFNVKWKYIGIAMLVLDALRILSGQNTGGYISHFGGYFLGFLYASQYRQGRDIGERFEKIVDALMSMFSREPKLKTVHKRSSKNKRSYAGKSKKEFHQFFSRKS